MVKNKIDIYIYIYRLKDDLEYEMIMHSLLKK